MEAQLVVIGGRVTKSIVSLDMPTVIGRGRQAKLKIAHPMISRRHCELIEKDGFVMIRDLGSLNGTLLNGKRIKEAPLPPGTEFTVEPLTFRIQYEYQGNLAALPAPVFADDTTDAPQADTPKTTANASASTAVEEAVPDFKAAEPLPDFKTIEPVADFKMTEPAPDFKIAEPAPLPLADIPLRPVTGGSDDFAMFGSSPSVTSKSDLLGDLAAAAETAESIVANKTHEAAPIDLKKP